ncbi:MAG: C40 family peptidase [Brevibacillus sp.]|nr:C40 family peptidase [Brevibacillus sp.]
MSIIDKLYGVPYKTAGDTTQGFDCSGFTRYVFHALGAEIPRTSAAQYNVGQAVAKQDLQPGDLVFFNTNNRGVSHVGIYIGSNTFVHSASGQGVVKTNLNDPYYWGKRYVGARRIPLPAVEAAKQEAADQAKQAAAEAAQPKTEQTDQAAAAPATSNTAESGQAKTAEADTAARQQEKAS